MAAFLSADMIIPDAGGGMLLLTESNLDDPFPDDFVILSDSRFSPGMSWSSVVVCCGWRLACTSIPWTGNGLLRKLFLWNNWFDDGIGFVLFRRLWYKVSGCRIELFNGSTEAKMTIYESGSGLTHLTLLT